MKLSVHGKRILAVLASAVLLLALIPLSTLPSFASQTGTGSGKINLLADHGGFDSEDDFGTGKWWFPEKNNTATAEWSENEGQNGTGALKLTRTGYPLQAYVYSQAVSVTPGEEYTLKYYQMTTAQVRAYVVVRNANADGDKIVPEGEPVAKEYADWTELTLTFTAPDSGKIRIDIGFNSGVGSALFDNFSLVGSSESTGNYLFNGDFEQENHAANWATNSDVPCEIEEGAGRDGGAALKVTNTGAKLVTSCTTIDATPNTVYNFSLWRKKDAPVQAYVQVAEFDAGGKELIVRGRDRNYLLGTGADVGDWQKYTFSHTTLADTAYICLRFSGNSGSGTAWFDDITITTNFKVTEIPATALKLQETKTEGSASLFTFAVDGVTLPQKDGAAYVNADPVQKLITKDYRYMFMAGVDSAERTDVQLVSGDGTVTLRFPDNNQSVYAVQKNAKKITLPAGTTFLDPADLSKGFRLTEAVVLYRNSDGWSQTCQHSYDSYQQVTAPTCVTEGSKKLTCSQCGFEDTQDIPVNVANHGDKLHEVPATSATCVDEGVVKHWYCDGCKNNYSDAAGTQKLNSIVDPVNPTAHNGKLREVAAVPATCEDEGVVKHWYCDGCKNNYSDAAGTQKLNSIVAPVDPTAHNGQLHEVDAVPATCSTPGVVKHWHCDGCDNNYSDAAGKEKLSSTVAPVDDTAHGDHIEQVDAKEATHEKDGNILYYHCTQCDRYFRDKEATEEIEYADTIVHHGEHVYADKWSVDTENHWKECACGSKTELGAHTFGEWTVTKQPTTTEKGERERVCTVCGTPLREELPTISETPTEKPDSSDTGNADSSAPSQDNSPKTGESMLLVVLALVLAGGALTALIVIRRKKQA